MLTNFIHINDFDYYVEFDDSQDYASTHRAKYVMLRKFSIMNNVVCDNNLYFIERGLFNKLKEQIKAEKKINCICFPQGYNHYSNSYSLFNDIMIDDDLTEEMLVYSLYDINSLQNENLKIEDIKEKDIKQNRFKIYHPHIKTKNDFVVHIENVINNIHMHYICNLYNNFEIHSSTELRLENNIYSEYIEIRIPDIRDLFGMSILDDKNITYSTYYKEDLNTVETTSEENKIFIEEILKVQKPGNADNDVKKMATDEDDNITQYLPLALLTQPFQLVQDENGDYKKKYYRHNLSISNNFMTAPINVILFPYEYLDDSNNLYILAADVMSSSATFTYDYMFELSSVCDFDASGRISFLTQIIYPKHLFNSGDNAPNTLSEAYCYMNGITNPDVYNVSYNNLYKEYQEELEEINCIKSVPESEKKVMVFENAKCLSMNDTELLEEYKRLKMESFLEEYMETYKTNIDFFGFRIEIGTDLGFKNIIFTQNQSLSKTFLRSMDVLENDFKNISFADCLNNHVFTFNINKLFDNWMQMPEMLIAKIYFIDRFTGFVIESNPVIIHKEKFKYIINDKDYYRLNYLTQENENLTQYEDNMKEYTINKDAFNFINNVNCIIHDDTDKNNIIIENVKDIINSNSYNTDTDKLNAIKTELNSTTGGVKSKNVNTGGNIIYQPIFFSTHTLDNLIIKKNINQNVGIDLHEYIAVVDTFVIYLDDKKYVEIGRNNSFVIFNINSLKLATTSGEYYLYNNNNEYITSGSWKLE